MSLEELGWDEDFARAFEALKLDDCLPGRVAADFGAALRVALLDGECLAERTGRLRHEARSRGELPVVGDWVALRRPAGQERGQIAAVLPRRSCFSRRAPGENEVEQPLAANLDTVFLVAGLDGDFNPRRLERALLLAFESGAQPVLVLNKADLAPDLGRQRREVEAVAQGVPVIVLSAKAGLGLEQLQPYLQPGRSVALLGSSGVGKSTIINRLLGQERQRTQEVREHDSRGRHTTTLRELLLLPTGGVLIDTPGLREIQLWAGEQALESAFDDVLALAKECGFRDCAHDREPRCGVRAAVEDGRLPAERLASYHKLQAELRYLERKTDLPAQAAEKRRWRAIHRSVRDFRPRR